jgi:hypothetical protein
MKSKIKGVSQRKRSGDEVIMPMGYSLVYDDELPKIQGSRTPVGGFEEMLQAPLGN